MNTKLKSMTVTSFFVVGLAATLFSQGNLVKNPSFEKEHNEWASDWYTRSYYEESTASDYILETGTAHSGDRCLTVRNKIPNDARIYQYVPVKPNTVYKISGWIRAEGVTGDTGGNIAVLDSFAMTRSVKDSGGNWEYVEMFGLTGKYQEKMPLAVRLGAWTGGPRPVGKVSFDDIALEQMTNRPGGVQIQSLSFADEYDDARASRYFERMSNPRYTEMSFHISLFFAIVLLLLSAGFLAFTLLVKGKGNRIERALTAACTKYYYVLIAILFVAFFFIFLIDPFNISVFDVRFSFVIILIAALGIGFYLYKNGALTPDNIAKLIIVLGVGIRLCYFLYTDANTRQHDLWGAWSHTEYIKYIGNNFALPPVGTYEAYHPPVHYILSGIVFKLARLGGLADDFAFRAVQLLMVFFSTISLVFIHKIYTILKCDERIKLIGIAFAAFLPNVIYMSVYLNNDQTLMLFYIIAIYFLIRWTSTRTMKDTILFAVFTALSILSKKSALALLVIGGIVFAVEFFKHKTEWKKFLVQGGVFIAIAIPVGLSYQLRNYILFQQDLSFAVPALGTVMPDDPYKLFWISAEKLLEQPISSQAPHERVFFVMELIRTALFSVFEWPGMHDLAVFFMFLFLVTFAVMMLNLILLRKKNLENSGYVLLVNFIVILLLYWQMRGSAKYDCTHAFRYIAPSITLSMGYLIGQGVIRFSGTRFPVFNFLVRAQFWVWTAVSAVFILAIGF